MMEKPIRVLLADDQPLIRHGLRVIINAQPDMEVAAEAGDGREAIAQAERVRPDVLLMDVQMPVCSGIEATRAISMLLPESQVVILTTFDLEQYVYDGIRAGAVGYLLKDAPPDELVEAIRAASRGEAVFRTAAAARAIRQAVHPAAPPELQTPLTQPMTERELEVLQQMAYGLRNEEIAAKLFIGESTVKTHVHRILQKIGAEDRTQAVVYAIRNRIVL
ncbi:response regulator transcription factor [Paenibacillus filicis]|uniref:Response regulator transcription factor n=1 Tax=Paenibacillus filicis TaxID=669464 RepID=A0ABU9DHR0_9BACL